MKTLLLERYDDFITNGFNMQTILIGAILLLLIVLAIVIVITIIRMITKKANPRKDTIFSHRKNRYKNRIGKKIK